MSTTVPKHKTTKRTGGRPADSGNRAIEQGVWSKTAIPVRDIRDVMLAIRVFVQEELAAGRSVNWAGFGTFKHRPWTPRTVLIKSTNFAAAKHKPITIKHTNYRIVFKFSKQFTQKIKHELPSY